MNTTESKILKIDDLIAFVKRDDYKYVNQLKNPKEDLNQKFELDSTNYILNECEAVNGYHYSITKGNIGNLLLVEYVPSRRKSNKIKNNVDLDKFLSGIKNIIFLSQHSTIGRYNHTVSSWELAANINYNNNEFVIVMPFSFAEQVLDLKIHENGTATFSNGQTIDISFAKYIVKNIDCYYNRKSTRGFDYTIPSLSSLCSRFNFNSDNTNNLLRFLSDKLSISENKGDGIKTLYNNLQPYLENLITVNPVAYCAFRSIVNSTNRSIDGVKVSVLFNEEFKNVDSQETLIKTISKFYSIALKNHKDKSYYHNDGLDDNVRKLDSFKVKRKSVIKSQAGRAMTKIMEDADSLTIDRKKHKKTWEKIESGELPLGAFFRKQEQYYILNDNWDLWEEMFKRGFGEEAIALADKVKGRSTYEKDLMSYFCFILYTLPKYLKKHTGQKWTCVPKLVDSEDELEPPKEENNGVAKRRSALTPIVDNEKKTVIVPYASLAIYGGRGTTYCYSHDYNVIHEGMSFNGSAIVNEIENKLNGRDDYGLMFFTLTGSVQGRGYPTFLIIFERRDSHKDTRVHFHRTHPSRSKSGEYNPIHNWVKTCYNWMIGNVRRDLIKAQQGDLAFVKIRTEDTGTESEGSIVKNLNFDYKVNKYDNHCFAEPVEFAEYVKAAKSNILGYVRLQQDTMLNHNEHDNVLIPKGTYAIYQCRSWEANPKGVWSLRID